jgi:hypothetical protein
MVRRIASTATTVVAFSLATVADAQNEPPAAETAGRPEEPVEEVIVRGKRTLFDLRKELQAARENVWGAFNALNSNDDFDISCQDAARTGTRVTRRVCRPQYSNAATSRAGKDLVRRIQRSCDPRAENFGYCLEQALQSGSAEAQQQIGLIAYMDQRLDEEFQRLALERPELAAAILEYQAKEREYADAVLSRKD